MPVKQWLSKSEKRNAYLLKQDHLLHLKKKMVYPFPNRKNIMAIRLRKKLAIIDLAMLFLISML